MQSKISSFFKPSSIPKAELKISPPLLSDRFDDAAAEPSVVNNWGMELSVTYKRRHFQKPNPNSDDAVQLHNVEMGRVNGRLAKPPLRTYSAGKIQNRKRSYAQYHLELGQSDFLHACYVCGMMYARGDEADERIHNKYHNNYFKGIQFKGWRNERVISTSCSNGDRILLVLDGDPPAQKQKVQLVIKVTEKELGFSNGALLHKLCKVYLVISSCRVVGCLIAEPIRTAHRVISTSTSRNNSDDYCTARTALTMTRRSKSVPLKFGNINFCHSKRELQQPQGGSIGYGSNSMWGGNCAGPLRGIRAVWVVPSNRRKRIASQLLDVARKSFSEGHELEIYECAFSHPLLLEKHLHPVTAAAGRFWFT